MTKAEIRSNQKELRKQLTQSEQKILNYEIREKLFQTEAFRKCENLLTFVSFEAEVDTHEIITQSKFRGKKVYVPRIEAREMEFYEMNNLNHLIRSKYGILEPAICEDTKFKNGSNSLYKNLMLLPGLAFDLSGNRIGYGAGYYDKYITSFPNMTFYKIALAYDFQILEHIPTEYYDRKAEEIITPSTIYKCIHEKDHNSQLKEAER